ncbi:MAG: carbon storage regulator [Oceanicoccus sp.]
MSLVITRKSGQSFSVGDATITLQIQNGQIRVVIDAPREMSVVRSELAEHSDRQ